MVSIGSDKYNKVGREKRPGRLAGACIEMKLGNQDKSAFRGSGFIGARFHQENKGARGVVVRVSV